MTDEVNGFRCPIDFRENIDPVFAKIFAKMESKIHAEIVRKSRKLFSKMSENFREIFAKIEFRDFRWKPLCTHSVYTIVPQQHILFITLG